VRDHFAAVEVAYNIVHALKRHSASNQDCKLFSAMLAGEIQFAIWVDRVALVEKLRVSLVCFRRLISRVDSVSSTSLCGIIVH
jgi:hypothetical protein